MMEEKERRDTAIRHLLADPDFREDVRKAFDIREGDPDWLEMQEAIRTAESEEPRLSDRMQEYLDQQFQDEQGTEVFSVHWDSENWGPGGNGYLLFIEVYGVVRMVSSDYWDDHFEIYDPETFSPWGPDTFDADTVEFDSEVYDDDELRERFGIGRDED
jgi:hypothetical protein